MIRKDDIGRYLITGFSALINDYELSVINYAVMTYGHLMGPGDAYSFGMLADKIDRVYGRDDPPNPQTMEIYRILHRCD